MKKYKHNQKWYENTHDILAATLLIGGIFFLVFICSLLECVEFMHSRNTPTTSKIKIQKINELPKIKLGALLCI